jgi:hypothetical protein
VLDLSTLFWKLQSLKKLELKNARRISYAHFRYVKSDAASAYDLDYFSTVVELGVN